MRASWTSRRLWSIAVTGVAIVVLASVALRMHLAGKPPNIVVVVVDSLRADRVGFMGSRKLTPFLDELAKEGTVYERAYAPSSWTVPVVASLFTGQYPSEHRATNFQLRIDEKTPTLAELLAERGYATTAVGANSALAAPLGFGRGFERYAIVGDPTFLEPKSDGWLVNDQVLRWVDEVGPARPQFLYLHYMDVHMPYRPHDEIVGPQVDRRRTDAQLNFSLVMGKWKFAHDEVLRLMKLYEGEVSYEDAVLRDLFEQLASRKFLDHALVIVTADHGEEFGSHGGGFGHGGSLHEELVRVPLLVKAPGVTPARVHEPVQLLGLTALILDAAGARTPPTVRVDALPATGAKAPPTVFSELVESGQKQRWLHKYALVTGRWKLLVNPDGTPVAYDLVADPWEYRPIPRFDPNLTAALDAQLASLHVGATPQQHEPDRSVVERLRALGYVPD